MDHCLRECFVAVLLALPITPNALDEDQLAQGSLGFWRGCETGGEGLPPEIGSPE